MNSTIVIIDVLVSLFSWTIILYIVLGYIVPPYHPFREGLGQFIEPLLQPIRDILPQAGMLDFSPLVLLLLVQIVGYLLQAMLVTFF